MFRSSGKTIVSDEGFTVELLHYRGGVRYTEGDRSVSIDAEVLAPRGIALYKDSITIGESPGGGSVLNNEDRERIIKNVCRAFEFIHFSVEVS